MLQKRLEMVFKNQLGRTNKITVDNARDNLTQGEVQTAMQAILDKNIFETSGGELVAIESAKIISTEIEEVVV